VVSVLLLWVALGPIAQHGTERVERELALLEKQSMRTAHQARAPVLEE
jgi:hypothetical protein